jgi:protein SCO1/2
MAEARNTLRARLAPVAAGLCLTMVCAPTPAETDNPHAGHAAHAVPASQPNVVHLDVPDVELLDQDGETGRFVSERIGDRFAAITFTFTTCTTICPVLDGISKRLQRELGDALGRETVLLTVSIDPARDIPERLKQHAERIGAQPGWTFLTGEQQSVAQLLKALEVWAPNIEDHPPVVYVVDGRNGVWTRLSGFPKPETIMAVIDRYRTARLADAGRTP